MKNTLFFLALALFLPVAAAAQSGLKFKQVRLIRNTNVAVPDNHVWKVEAFMNSEARTSTSFNISTCNNEDNQSSFYVNSDYYFVFRGIATGTSSLFFTPGNEFPFWLPAGNTMRTVCPGDFISVLEFEVLP